MVTFNVFVSSATVIEWKISLRKEAVWFKEATTKELELKNEKELWKRFIESFVESLNTENSSSVPAWSFTKWLSR